MSRMLPVLAACAWLAACSQGEAPQPGVETAPAGEESATAPAAPAPEPAPPPPLAAPLEVGSQEARDDLYCAGLIAAANPTPLEAVTPVSEARIQNAQLDAFSLSEVGVQKIIAEGSIVSSQAGQVIDAWMAQALNDFDAGKPRIELAACEARAKALPPAP